MTYVFGGWLDMFDEKETVYSWDDQQIDITYPQNLVDDRPPLQPIEGYKIATLQDNYTYFAQLLDECDVRRVHDMETGCESGLLATNTRHCDYCPSTPTCVSYRCNICDTHMCLKCYSLRKTPQVIMNNGNLSQKKKNSLLTCYDHDTQGEMQRVVRDAWYHKCNICRCNPLEKPGMWRLKYAEGRNDNDFTICPQCTLPSEMHMYTHYIPHGRTETRYFDTFGSILDWIMILIDKEGDALLLNMNASSPLYGRVSLLVSGMNGGWSYILVPGNVTGIICQLTDPEFPSEDYPGPIAMLASILGHSITH